MRQATALKQRKKLRDSPKEPLVESIKTKRRCGTFSPEDEAYIIKRRKELERQGMKDAQIARLMAGEMNRGFQSVESKLRNLTKAGKLPENRNKIKSFSNGEIQFIIRRRKELEAQGKNDGAIAKKIAQEIGRPEKSVYQKILILKNQKVLPENRNRLKQKRYSTHEKERVRNRRNKLLLEGLNDRAISLIIANETQKSLLSIYHLIRSMVKCGDLPPNINKLEIKKYSESEKQYISEIRAKLSAQGLNNAEIAKQISEELGRPAKSIVDIIYRLEQKQEISENKNKKKGRRFTEEELEYIKTRRNELLQQGLKDGTICETISKETDRSPETLKHAINKLISQGKVSKNKNNLIPFSKDEKRYIQRKRKELVGEGLNDTEIAQKISKETRRSKNTILGFFKRLIRSKDLSINPNRKTAKRFEAWEIVLVIKRREELEKEGDNDKQISEKVSKETERDPGSIRGLICRMVKQGKLKENKNKIIIKKLSESELLFIKQKRNELIQEGRNDKQISEHIAKSLQRSPKTIRLAIDRSIKNNRFSQNPNKKNRGKKPPLDEINKGLSQAAYAMEKFGDAE
jgi:hypothetical protein